MDENFYQQFMAGELEIREGIKKLMSGQQDWHEKSRARDNVKEASSDPTENPEVFYRPKTEETSTRTKAGGMTTMWRANPSIAVNTRASEDLDPEILKEAPVEEKHLESTMKHVKSDLQNLSALHPVVPTQGGGWKGKGRAANLLDTSRSAPPIISIERAPRAPEPRSEE